MNSPAKVAEVRVASKPTFFSITCLPCFFQQQAAAPTTLNDDYFSDDEDEDDE